MCVCVLVSDGHAGACVQKPAAPLAASASRHLALTKPSKSSQSAYQKPEEEAAAAAAPQTPVAPGPGLHALPCGFLPSEPGRWNIEDVYDFISSLPGGYSLHVCVSIPPFWTETGLFPGGAAGCLEIAEEFRSQEIDGQALLLLKEDHLMATMNIKLGPALKIFAQINSLKDS